MRFVAGTFGIVCGLVVIAIAARYGFKTSDNDFDGYIWAFMYGSVSFGGLFGHALAVRVWRHSKLAGALVFAGSAIALIISLSNSLGAMAGRGNESQAKRIQVAETVRNLRRSLDRSEREREGLSFTPSDAEAVKAAKAKADAAANAREAECKKRGDKCREREADEGKALAGLETATRNKSVTDRARTLDIEIAETKAKIERAGPVLEANPQGSAFARLFDLPDSKASFLSAWQNLAMAVTVEMLIVLSMIAFEVLSKGEMPKATTEPQGKREDDVELAGNEGGPVKPLAFLEPQKPRLIASRADPAGNVATIMASVLEPGKARDKAELAEIFKAYAQVCRQQGKRPVPPEEFSAALQRLCGELSIKVTHKGEHVYLMKVRLNLQAAASRA